MSPSGIEARDAADAVHVALHKVAAEAGAGGERAFEIYEMAGFLFARNWCGGGFRRRDRRRNACASNSTTVRQQPLTEMLSPSFVEVAIAISDSAVVGGACEADAEATAVLRVLERLDFSYLFGDACEHLF